jgi:hypothetical protein
MPVAHAVAVGMAVLITWRATRTPVSEVQQVQRVRLV